MAGDQVAPGWLRDEPTTWNEVNRALQDVLILLQYLGEQPDARLSSCFEDTRVAGNDRTARAAVPPCPSYQIFLTRLFRIASAFQTGDSGRLSQEDRPGGDPGEFGAVAFVYAARDFLSAVAAPTTAESIRLTRAFLVKRSRFWSSLFRRRRLRPPAETDVANEAIVGGSQPGGPHPPALPPDPGAPTRNRLARKLANRVALYEWVCLAAILVTGFISIYALTGRLILNSEQSAWDAWKAIDARVEAEEVKMFKPPTLPLSESSRTGFEAAELCTLIRKVPDEHSAVVKTASAGDQAAEKKLADLGTPVSPAPSAPAGESKIKLYAEPEQRHLCDEVDRAGLHLFVVTMHMQSWSGIVTEGWGRALSTPFGVNPAILSEYANEDNKCFGLRADTKVNNCERVLWDEIDRSRDVANAILGAITQYLLPVLYAFLGAMAAALRSLRRKVDASLLTYTDRAQLQQRLILGVLCGAVIGLFAAFLSSSGAAGAIGASALALLAGYNVDGVFHFLDELSDRLFRPAGAKPAS